MLTKCFSLSRSCIEWLLIPADITNMFVGGLAHQRERTSNGLTSKPNLLSLFFFSCAIVDRFNHTLTAAQVVHRIR